MMLGLSFGHIFGLDHFYIPGLFEGFNKSLLISMWTMTILGSPMANVMFFQGFKQQRGRLGDHGGLLFSQQRRSAVSVSWESPPWGRRSSRFCAEPLTEQQHQSNHCDLVLLPKKVGEPRESAWSN